MPGVVLPPCPPRAPPVLPPCWGRSFWCSFFTTEGTEDTEGTERRKERIGEEEEREWEKDGGGSPSPRG